MNRWASTIAGKDQAPTLCHAISSVLLTAEQVRALLPLILLLLLLPLLLPLLLLLPPHISYACNQYMTYVKPTAAALPL